MEPMYFVYVIENVADQTWYIGFTTDVARRLEEHQKKIGGEYTKRHGGEWHIIYLEGYLEKSDAIGRERYLKSGAGRLYLKKQMKHYLLGA